MKAPIESTNKFLEHMWTLCGMMNSLLINILERS